LAATVSRLSRSAMLEVISQDYIRTARAKGHHERAVVYKHALRNMMVPLLTIIGLFVAIALTGTVLTETVFTRPGLGKMLVDAIGARDYPLAQGAITVFTVIIITVNLVVDMLYAVVDARISLQVGLASVIFAFALGVPLGIVAGMQGGRVETAVMRCADMLMAFPTLLLALIIVTALGGSLVNEILAIGVALTPNFVRLARSLALTIREQDYILAARALGGGQLRIMARHVFPNALYALVVVATLYIATAIRTEAGLSFLGLGIPPPTPSWGNILSEGRQYIKCCPWITTFS